MESFARATAGPGPAGPSASRVPPLPDRPRRAPSLAVPQRLPLSDDRRACCPARRRSVAIRRYFRMRRCDRPGLARRSGLAIGAPWPFSTSQTVTARAHVAHAARTRTRTRTGTVPPNTNTHAVTVRPATTVTLRQLDPNPRLSRSEPGPGEATATLRHCSTQAAQTGDSLSRPRS
jgi:hypothetical protein